MSQTNTYWVGQDVTLPCTLSDPTKTPADPNYWVDVGALACRIRQPDGSEATPTVLHDSTGHYHAVYNVVMPGLHTYVFVGTGGHSAVDQGQFMARALDA